MAQPGFWDDYEQSQRIIGQLKRLKEKVGQFTELWEDYEDLITLQELSLGDEELLLELAEGVDGLSSGIELLSTQLLFSGEYDSNNAIITMHAGAGGTESQDWVGILLRMYLRWAEKKGFQVEVVDQLPGEEAGVKSVVFFVQGEMAYGHLRSEMGVHRLVRISPFDASGRRHTSFASVSVMPDLPEDVDLEINPAELRIDTYRAGGAGGQHVNKTSSAVRITHLPTGIVAQCQNERSQHSNRNTAMKLLKAKLFQLEQEKQRERNEHLKGDQQEIGWGSQIRSYVIHPYSLVKDHRTGVEAGNVQAVLDGDLDQFIFPYLQQSTGRENNKN
jgi:peptide chain release factor 2